MITALATNIGHQSCPRPSQKRTKIKNIEDKISTLAFYLTTIEYLQTVTSHLRCHKTGVTPHHGLSSIRIQLRHNESWHCPHFLSKEVGTALIISSQFLVPPNHCDLSPTASADHCPFPDAITSDNQNTFSRCLAGHCDTTSVHAHQVLHSSILVNS